MSLDLSKYEKCTTGPWKVIENSCSDTSVYPESGGLQICSNSIYEISSEETQEVLAEVQSANFALIADAPQLLAELREARAINQELAGALGMLLDDTQHKDHECGGDCPVIHAKVALQKYEVLTRKDA